MVSLKIIIFLVAAGAGAFMYYRYKKKVDSPSLENDMIDVDNNRIITSTPPSGNTHTYFYPEDEIPEVIRNTYTRTPYIPGRGCNPGYVPMELRGADTAGVIGNPPSRRVVCQQVANNYVENSFSIANTLGKYGPAYGIAPGAIDYAMDPRMEEWYMRSSILSNLYFGTPGGSYGGSGYSQMAGGIGALPKIYEQPTRIG